MRARTLVTAALIACALTACRDDDTQVVTKAGPALSSAPTTDAHVASSSSTSIPATTSQLDVIRGQIATAATQVCAVISAENVQLSFRESAPLRTQPMSEASGPACGYPHPRQGGYLLVVQFQVVERWAAYAQTGKIVLGLGRDAVVTGTTNPQLNVLDTGRSAVVVFLAPDSQPGSLDALLDVAAFAYAVPRDGVHVGT